MSVILGYDTVQIPTFSMGPVSACLVQRKCKSPRALISIAISVEQRNFCYYQWIFCTPQQINMYHAVSHGLVQTYVVAPPCCRTT